MFRTTPKFVKKILMFKVCCFFSVTNIWWLIHFWCSFYYLKFLPQKTITFVEQVLLLIRKFSRHPYYLRQKIHYLIWSPVLNEAQTWFLFSKDKRVCFFKNLRQYQIVTKLKHFKLNCLPTNCFGLSPVKVIFIKKPIY